MSKYYDINRILSYKAQVSVIVGVRGYGKTYGFKKKGIRNFLDKGEQFVWVRRYKTELVEVKKTFWDAIRNDKDLKKRYGELKYEVEGDKGLINGEVACFFIPLSTSATYKSSDFPKVTMLVFDEFIIESGKTYYMQNELSMFYSLLETIQRDRYNVRAILIGNAINFNNPYFIGWKIKPFKSEFLHLKDRSIVIQMAKGDEFIREKQKSNFGKLVRGTKYEEMAIHNKFIDDNDKFIAKKTDDARYLCSVKYEDEEIAFWFDYTTGTMYANMLVDKQYNIKYSLSQLDHDINYYLVKNYKGTHLKTIIECYQLGVLYFSDLRVKGIVQEMMMLFGL